MVEAADVEPGGRAAGFDLSQRDLDHRAEAFDLVEKRNAVAHADQTRPETKIIFFGTGSIWQIVSISNKSFFDLLRHNDDHRTTDVPIRDVPRHRRCVLRAFDESPLRA